MNYADTSIGQRVVVVACPRYPDSYVGRTGTITERYDGIDSEHGTVEVNIDGEHYALMPSAYCQHTHMGCEQLAPEAPATIMVEGRTFTIITRDGENADKVPYELKGVRGAHYALMRNVRTPYMLFVFNMKGFTRHSPEWWFTDKDGELRWVR